MASPRYWAAIPAAGLGTRMHSDRPKQYLTLGGKTVLERALLRVAAHPAVAGVVLALSPDDPVWPTLAPRLDVNVMTTPGGAERCHSVLACLTYLRDIADEDDWVLVHDAARPCVRTGDIERLIRTLQDDPVGGLLAVPVKETLKRANGSQRVDATVDRSSIWRAQTPQMFRLGALHAALASAIANDVLVTDEAQAMELAGHHPNLVAGHEDNVKLTVPEDRWLAELYLQRQEETGCV